jgi:O-antigen/teichoic acid export membrane protein
VAHVSPVDHSPGAELASAPLARRVAWNTGVQIGARIATLGISFVSIVLLTRYLGVDGYGDFTAALVYVGLYFVFFDLGTYPLLVRQLSQGLAPAHELIGKALMLRFALSLLVTAAAAPLPFLMYPGADREQLRVGILIALPTIAIHAVANTIAAIFQAQLKLDRLAVAEIVSQLALVSLIIALVATDQSFYAIMAATVISAAVNAAVIFVLGRRLIPITPSIDVPYWKRLFLDSLPLGLALVINTIYFRVDALLLSVLKDSDEVGIYGVAYRFFETATPFAYFLVASLFPLLSAAAATGDRNAVRNLSQRAFDVLSLGAILVVSGIMATSPGVVELVAGSDFERAATPLRIVIVGAGLTFLSTYLAYLLISVDRQRSVLWLSTATLAFNVTLNLVLIPEYGYNAAASVATASQALLLVGSLWLAHRHTGFLAEIGVAARGIVAGSAMFLAAYALPTHVLLALAAGTLVYLAGLYLLRVHESIQLRAILLGSRR